MAVDATLAARALGVFGIVRDRLEGRNTPASPSSRACWPATRR
ncbi:hypothetical protein [Nannocystis pusilla]